MVRRRRATQLRTTNISEGKKMNESTSLAVVTGGASGIGEATARRFAASGYRVVIGDINAVRGESVAAELRRAGSDVTFYEVDLASDATIASCPSTVSLTRS
jgi:NAD(P)-dependent dehydrogenase (short-subunit alcohol dehydrogenase family)